MNGHPRFPELGLWATIHKESGKFIGRCGLLPWTINGQMKLEVAYTIAQEYWGQGLASEAAEGHPDLRLRTFELVAVDQRNRFRKYRFSKSRRKDRHGL